MATKAELDHQYRMARWAHVTSLARALLRLGMVIAPCVAAVECRLAATGELDFDSDVYRSMETLICGMQRYAHRMTFMIYLFSFDYQQKNSREKGRPDVYERMLQKTTSAPPDVQAELKAILRDVSDDLAKFVTTSSLLFMSAIPVAIAAHHLNRMGTFTKERVSATLANEAYMAECRKGPRTVAA